MSNDKYVVIEYTQAAGDWAGNRYITSMGNENLDLLKERLGERQKVVAHDVSMDEAQRITSQVPVECIVAAAFEESKIDGKIEPMMLQMQLANTAFLVGHNAQMRGIPSQLASLAYFNAVLNYVDNKIPDLEEKRKVMVGFNSTPF